MSVRVRLTRVGSKKNPIWRVVVADQRSPRDGRFIETIGHYNPQTNPSTIVVDAERFDHWVSRGARPTGSVKKLMVARNRQGVPAAATAPPDSATDEPGPAADEPDTTAEPVGDQAAAQAAAGEITGEDATAEPAAAADSTQAVGDDAAAEASPDEAAPADSAEPETGAGDEQPAG